VRCGTGRREVGRRRIGEEEAEGNMESVDLQKLLRLIILKTQKKLISAIFLVRAPEKMIGWGV